VSALTEVTEPTGRQIMEGIMEGRLPRPKTAAFLGVQLVEVDDGRTVFEFMADERFDNGDGSVHGGILATLADFAVATAIRTRIPAGAFVATTNLNVTYVHAVPSDRERIRCEGRAVHVGRTLGHAEATVTSAGGRICVLAVGTCTIRPAR
jgi:uncharacterized protein (TIGR00369 family)